MIGNPAARFWLRDHRMIDGLDGMGTKYLPTNKDRKLSLRFQQQQNVLSRLTKSSRNQPPQKRKKK